MTDGPGNISVLPKGNPRRLSLSAKVLLWIAAAIILLLAAMWSTFGSFSVCRVCGQKRYQTDWQLPFTNVTYLSTHRDEETALSKFLDSRNLVGQHDHAWVFGHGGGPGIHASGPMLMMSRRLSDEREFQFLDVLLKFGRKKEAEEWARRALDPDQVSLPIAPRDELRTDEEFNSWWQCELEFYEKASKS